MDPGERATAIVRAAQTGDHSAIPRLIALLEHDDPGTRLLAIGALERLTGRTFGYDYAAPDAERSKSVEQWVQWQAREPGSSGRS